MHIVVAFAGEQNLEKTKAALSGAGFPVLSAYRSVAETLRAVSVRNEGIIVCGFKLLDGTARQIAANMPAGFHMLLVAPPAEQALMGGGNIFTVQMPASAQAVIASVNMISQFMRIQARPPDRTPEDSQIIEKAKERLMQSHGISESQAHRLLQKKSMESGKKLIEIALEYLNS